MGCKGYDRVHDRVYDSVGDDKSLTENELSGGRCTVEKTDDIVSGEVYDRVHIDFWHARHRVECRKAKYVEFPIFES